MSRNGSTRYSASWLSPNHQYVRTTAKTPMLTADSAAYDHGMRPAPGAPAIT